MVQFKRFKMQGAFSYGNCDVTFEPGLVLLEGKNLDQGEKVSNMAGKTSVFDGVTTAMFEQNSKGQVKEDIVNVLDKGDAVLELDLNAYGKEVRIVYSRINEKTDWTITVDGESRTKSINEMKKIIPDIIGMNYNMFMIASYMEQGERSKFMELDDSSRKDIYLKYFGLDKCDVLREKVKEARRAASEELIAVTAKISTLKPDADSEEFDIKKIDKRMKELGVIIERGMPISQEEYDEAGEEFKILFDLDKKNKNIVEELRKAKDVRVGLRGDMSQTVDIIDKLKGDKCYVCGTKINGKKLLKQQEDKKEDTERKLRAISDEITYMDDIVRALDGFNASDAKKDLINLKKRIGDKEGYNNAREELGGLKNQRKNAEKREQDVSELEEEKAQLSETMEALDFWYEGFSPRGLPSMVLSRLLGGLNSSLKLYGDRLGWNVTCIIDKDKDKLKLNVSDKWKTLKVGYYSGSEETIISAILSFGHWHWANAKGRGTNVLFLDEIFAPFDPTMRLRVAELLLDIAKNRCVVVVTHNEDVKNFINWDRIWVAEKKNGVTSLKQY